MFDVAFGAENVISGRINDPSRDKPGDVCVVSEDVPFKAIEVKDKPVEFNEIQIFGQKCIDMGVTDAAYVLVAERQEKLDETALQEWASRFGLTLVLFYDWRDLIAQSLYWSPRTLRASTAMAVDRIGALLIAIEAHSESLQAWFGNVGLGKTDPVRSISWADDRQLRILP